MNSISSCSIKWLTCSFERRVSQQKALTAFFTEACQKQQVVAGTVLPLTKTYLRTIFLVCKNIMKSKIKTYIYSKIAYLSMNYFLSCQYLQKKRIQVLHGGERILFKRNIIYTGCTSKVTNVIQMRVTID